MQQPSVLFASFRTDEIQGGYYPHYEKVEMKKEQDLLRLASWRDIYSSCTIYEPPQEVHLPPSVSNCGVIDNSRIIGDILPTQRIQDTQSQENIQPRLLSFAKILKNQQHSSSSDSPDLLRSYASGFTKSKSNEDLTQNGDKKLSAEEIVRIAGERFIYFTTQGVDHTLLAMHPYGSSFSGLSIEEQQDVDLAHLLLAAADKVGRKQFERAMKLLEQCESIATDTGNPVQRVVYYFAQALRERIGRETGRITRRRIDDTTGTSTNLVFLKFYQEIPFNQVTVSAGIQAILENVQNESEIHLIDLQIRSGIQWTAFMQSLAERVSCRVKHFKLTAIGTTERSKMEETCKRLENLAKTLDLSFSYSIIFLSDMKDLQQEHFQMSSQERPVIYCPLILRTMISKPDCLEHLIGVMKKLNPSMMVVTEVEANLNSPSFFNRFIETLFFYGAYFDCLEECTDRDNDYRNILERVFFGDGIHNIVGAEGEERSVRSVKMNVWGAFFKRFGIVQMELSESSLYLASLNLKRFSCASSCTLEKKGESLSVGWKGTPIESLSTWKFL